MAGLILLIPILGGFLYFLKPILQIHGYLIFNIIDAVVTGSVIVLISERQHFKNINALIKELKEIKNPQK